MFFFLSSLSPQRTTGLGCRGWMLQTEGQPWLRILFSADRCWYIEGDDKTEVWSTKPSPRHKDHVRVVWRELETGSHGGGQTWIPRHSCPFFTSAVLVSKTFCSCYSGDFFSPINHKLFRVLNMEIWTENCSFSSRTSCYGYFEAIEGIEPPFCVNNLYRHTQTLTWKLGHWNI